MSSDDLGDVDIDNDDDDEVPKPKKFGTLGADMRREAAAPQPEASPKNKVGDDSAEFRESQVLSMFRDDKKGEDDGDAKKGSFDDLSDILGVKAPGGLSRSAPWTPQPSAINLHSTCTPACPSNHAKKNLSHDHSAPRLSKPKRHQQLVYPTTKSRALRP